MVGTDLKRLFLTHRRTVQLYLADRLGDRDAAADLTQEAFLRFAEQAADRSVVDDRSYLYRTARNLAIDHVRRAVRQRTSTVTHEDLAGFRDDHPDPEEVVGARQQLDRLRSAVLELPKRTRAVFVLVRIEGLTYAAAAKRLGISESSVQKHLVRALRHVMQHAGPR